MEGRSIISLWNGATKYGFKLQKRPQGHTFLFAFKATPLCVNPTHLTLSKVWINKLFCLLIIRAKHISFTFYITRSYKLQLQTKKGEKRNFPTDSWCELCNIRELLFICNLFEQTLVGERGDIAFYHPLTNPLKTNLQMHRISMRFPCFLFNEKLSEVKLLSNAKGPIIQPICNLILHIIKINCLLFSIFYNLNEI